MTSRSLVASTTVLLALSACSKTAPAPAGAASAAVTTATPGLAGFKDFEGEIDLLAKSAKQKKPIPPIAVMVKGTKVRFDVPTEIESGPRLPGKTYVVLSAPEKKMFAVIDAQKQVVVMGLDSLREQMKQWKPPHSAAEPETPATPPKITKTGHTDTVAGYSCEDWDIVSAKGEHAKVCVANEGASWFQLPSSVLPTDSAWASEILDGNHMPLRFIGYDAAGAEDGRLEVTKLEKKPVLDSQFEIPAGYRVMDLSEMMRGLMGGMMLGGMAGGAMPGVPGAAPAGSAPGAPGMGLPPGFAMPPGVQLPPGAMPPGMKMPPNAAAAAAASQEMLRQLQERARAGAAAAAAAPPTK